MDWTDLDIDQAAEEVWKRNHTRTKLDTIKAMMRGEKETPHALTGYRRDADFKQQQIALGQVAERLAAARLNKLDPTAHHLLAPDNNNSRDIYVARGGVVAPDQGYQVKVGDPNEHIYYTLRDRLRSGNNDSIILDGSLYHSGTLQGFTPYKGEVLKQLLDETGTEVIGMPGLTSLAKTIRDREASDSTLERGMLKIVEIAKKLRYGY